MLYLSICMLDTLFRRVLRFVLIYRQKVSVWPTPHHPDHDISREPWESLHHETLGKNVEQWFSNQCESRPDCRWYNLSSTTTSPRWKKNNNKKILLLKLNTNRWHVIGCICVGGFNVQNWIFELLGRSLQLASCCQYQLIVNFDNTWTKSGMSQILQCLHIWDYHKLGGWPHAPWVFAQWLLRLGNLGSWDCG